MTESRNADLHYNYARLFARFCGRNPEVLSLTAKLLDTALSLQPENPAYLCEYGLQKSMVGEFTESAHYYQRAASQNENDL